jgi:phosphate starvation-inducible PhoH-like protein
MAQNRSKKYEEITETIREKRASKKKPISFQIQLNDEQKEAKQIILDSAITVLSGKGGSGKTLLATQVGLDLLFREEVKKIYIVRPTVSDEEIGFLPGNLKEKLDPWLQPIYENFYMLYNKEKIDDLLSKEIIEIVPIAFMRGRTLANSLIIIDEAQNCTDKQLEMIQSRLGIGGKMIICGDLAQVDLKGNQTGFKYLFELAKIIPEYGSYMLKNNHRHGIVDAVLSKYEAKRESI